MQFQNRITGEVLSHPEFVTFVWGESEKQFNKTHKNNNWCNLTKEEQIIIYCIQYEYQLQENNWSQI